MIISFEGPSAVGKSSLSRLLADRFTVVPEANILFEGEERKGRFWYYEKQVLRYQLAHEAEQAILDGDPFQPLWYNWTYNYPPEFQELDEMREFYAQAIVEGKLRFPDLYCIFSTDKSKLTQRKEGDALRVRRRFEKHLKLTETLPRYFGHLKSCYPNLVEFVRYDDQQEALQSVEAAVESRRGKATPPSLEVLGHLCDWLIGNKA